MCLNAMADFNWNLRFLTKLCFAVSAHLLVGKKFIQLDGIFNGQKSNYDQLCAYWCSLQTGHLPTVIWKLPVSLAFLDSAHSANILHIFHCGFSGSAEIIIKKLQDRAAYEWVQWASGDYAGCVGWRLNKRASVWMSRWLIIVVAVFFLSAPVRVFPQSV